MATDESILVTTNETSVSTKREKKNTGQINIKIRMEKKSREFNKAEVSE